MPESRGYFDFLNLPRELRDEIYEYVLCSFAERPDRYTIQQCATVPLRAVFEERRFTGNINLLLANKQTHEEGYKCMIKKNMFVLIQCPYDSLQTWIYGHPPPISILKHLRHCKSEEDTINAYPWYVMRLRIEKHGDSGSTNLGYRYPDIVMLLEDCTDMFKRFGVHGHELPSPGPNGTSDPIQQPLKITVELNPKKKSHDKERSYTKWWTSHSAVSPRRLLEHVKDGFRKSDHVEIQNCDDEALVTDVIKAVPKCHSISLDDFRSHIESHAHSAGAAWESGNFIECANFCAKGLDLVQRVGSNGSLMRKLRDDGLENCLDASKSGHMLHLLLARCICTHVSTLMDSSAEGLSAMKIGIFAKNLLELLRWYYFTVHAFLPHWHLSTDEQAEACYMRARAMRLGCEYCNFLAQNELPRAYIQDALRLQPDNPVYKEELVKANAWFKDYRRFFDWAERGPGFESSTMLRWRRQIDHTKYQW